MKKSVLNLAILFFVHLGFSQNYKPLLANVNEWHFTNCYFGCVTDVYYTDGDTLVEGKTYKILDGYHYISRTFLLREDIPNKKVYIKILNHTADEVLLYDFGLNQGDIFNMENPITPFPRNGGPFVLDSIVSKPLADGNLYRHFYFSPTPGNTNSSENAVWVEGVGSLSLINAPGGHPNINGVGQLSCSFKNSEVIYTNLDSISNCFPTILGTGKNILAEVLITGKNDNEQIRLTHTQNVQNVKVYGLSGKLLQSRKNDGNDFLDLDLSSYSSGLYLIEIKGRGKARRIVKVGK